MKLSGPIRYRRFFPTEFVIFALFSFSFFRRVKNTSQNFGRRGTRWSASDQSSRRRFYDPKKNNVKKLRRCSEILSIPGLKIRKRRDIIPSPRALVFSNGLKKKNEENRNLFQFSPNFCSIFYNF